MRRFNKRISLLLLISLLFSSLTAPPNSLAKGRAAANALRTDKENEEEGLRFRLSQAPDQPEAQPTSKLAPTTMLSDVETANILKRLAPIKAESPGRTRVRVTRAIAAAAADGPDDQCFIPAGG